MNMPQFSHSSWLFTQCCKCLGLFVSWCTSFRFLSRGELWLDDNIIFNLEGSGGVYKSPVTKDIPGRENREHKNELCVLSFRTTTFPVDEIKQYLL